MKTPKTFLLILFTFCSLNGFTQNDSLVSRKINFRAGIGIFVMPGIFAEKNISEKISVEAGLLTYIVLNEASVGLKYHLYGKNDFKIKAGIGCGMTAHFWQAQTDPPKSGKDIFIMPLIPVEFIYKKVSLELQPGYPIKLSGYDDAQIPIIVFLSYMLSGKS